MAAETDLANAASLTLKVDGNVLTVSPEHIATFTLSTPHDVHGEDGNQRIGRGHIVIMIDLADDVTVGSLWS